MSLKAELDKRYMTAMRARDSHTAEIVRAVRAKVLEEKKKPDFKDGDEDELYLDVISRYVKQLEKALPDFDKAGDAGAEKAAAYREEIEYLKPFLPQKLDEAETRALVTKVIEELGASDPKQMGRVMGTCMKGHKDVLDAGLARRLIEELLGH